MDEQLNIAIIGAGPSGLYIFKKLIDSGATNINIDVLLFHLSVGTIRIIRDSIFVTDGEK